MTLLILADDLTGAADSAARCHHAGLAAHVYLTATDSLPAGAVAFNTDSRYLAPAAAATQVSLVVTPFARSQSVQWYKKIDSTLRGNIGAELEAMLAILTPASTQPCAVICPAFPAQGRGLVDGYLVYAHAAAHTIHLPTLLSQQTDRPVAAISLTDVRADLGHLVAKLTQAHQQGAQLFVLDAVDDADLSQVLAATQQALPGALFCGSAGFIGPLARNLASAEWSPLFGEAASVQLRRPIFAVSGSGSAMAHQQLARLRQQSDVRVIEVQYKRTPEITLVAEPNHWVYHLPYPEQEAQLEGPAARDFVAYLTHVAAALIEQLQPGTLILVGGDTAVHLLHQLGITQLTVLCELMPGIPLLEGIDARGKQRQIITKAGNFGDAETLVQLFQRA